MAQVLRAAGASLDEVNDHVENRIHCLRRIGERITEMQEAGELATQETGRPLEDDMCTALVHLSDFDISRNQSSRYKRLASVPEDDPTEFFEKTRETDDTLTVMAAYRLGTPPAGEPQMFPKGTYRILYADPPWKYSDKLVDGYGAVDHHKPYGQRCPLTHKSQIDGISFCGKIPHIG